MKATAPQPIPAPAAAGKYIYAIGRRKRAIASVRLFPSGSGQFIVNKMPMKEYFPAETLQMAANAPLRQAGMQEQVDIHATVKGGGVAGQADGVKLGIARALIDLNPALRTALKKEGYLTRDSRRRERKKYGKKSARRSPQWSKR
ncbi:30S ribosomal protein S9 [Candidatus Uhrbacteria bacterium]|nr:30S ribosomal protein S9 [Candidatus Uhrbacteria bacterium]